MQKKLSTYNGKPLLFVTRTISLREQEGLSDLIKPTEADRKFNRNHSLKYLLSDKDPVIRNRSKRRYISNKGR